MGRGPFYPLLRFDGAVKREPAIDAWIDDKPVALAAIARIGFATLRACGSDVRELIHDGHPTACVEDAPFGSVNVFASHVNVGFFHGASLPDPARILEGAGKYMRHVKLRPGVEAAAPALEALARAAYADVKERLEAERSGR